MDVSKLNVNGVQKDIYELDRYPRKDSDNLIATKELFTHSSIIDISELNATENPHTLATYENLSEALAALPDECKKGGMTVKFVQTDNNEYVQYKLLTSAFSSIIGNWQKVSNSQLEVKLQGITAEETKVVLEENSNWYDFKYVASDGRIKNSVTNTGIPNGVLIVDVTGCKKVRFLGYLSTSPSGAGYGFSANPIDPTSSEVQLEATEFRSDGTEAQAIEYVIDVPDGMNYFACTIRKYDTSKLPGIMTISDFYCYVQTGYTVYDELALSGVFDVTSHNNGASFTSISDILTDYNIDTIIPIAMRRGGMSIKFANVDNIYVQYHYIKTSTDVSDFINVNNWELEVTNKILSDDFLGLISEIKDYYINNYYINSEGKFGHNENLKHAVIAVNVGEIYYFTGTKYCRVALTTSNTCSPDSDVPIVPNTSIITLVGGQYYKLVIPEGCSYLMFNIGNDYQGRCFKHYDSFVEEIYDSQQKIEEIIQEQNEFKKIIVFKNDDLYSGAGAFYYIPLNENGFENLSFIKSSDAGIKRNNSKVIGLTRLNQLKEDGYNKITIYSNSFYDTYITFTTKSMADLPSMTFSELKDSETLSLVHADSAVFVIQRGKTMTFDIPKDCNNIYFTGVNYLQDSIGFPTDEPFRIPYKVILTKDMFSLYTESEIDVRHYPLYDKSINSNGEIDTNGYSVCIPLFNTKIVKIFTGGSGSRINFLKEPISSGIIEPATDYEMKYIELESNSEITKEVPNDAKYIFVHISGSIGTNMYSDYYCPKSLIFISEKEEDNTKEYGFDIGNIGIDGKIHKDNYHAASGFIDLSKGFYVKFNDEYKIYASHLYDMNGNIMTYDYLPPTDDFYAYPFALQDYSMYSIAFSIPYKLRFVVVRRDGQEITNVHNIIKSFIYLNDGRLQLETPDFPLENYRNFRSRIRQLAACISCAQGCIPTTSYSTGINLDRIFYRKNQYRAGVAYSLNAQLSKAVGMEISLRTYLSAIANKNSVMYTENLNSNNSKYGISYSTTTLTAAVSYYGVVCTSFVGYALNMKMFYRSGFFKNGKVPYTQVIENVNGNTIKVGDLIWNDGHISVISEIYNDNTGKRCFIVWAEQTKPTPYITAMTPQEFDNRLAHYNYGQADAIIQVLRFSNWESVNTPCNFDGDISLSDFFETNKIIEPLKDVQSFAGDYACFTDDEPLFFNINISKGYTKFQVFDQNDTLVNNIDISSLQPYVIYSNDYNWGRLDYTHNSLSGGLYKARCINESDNTTSDYTYFEIVKITFSITKLDNIYDCIFSCSNNATPYLLRKEDSRGYEPSPTTDYMLLNGTETQESLVWSITSTYKYIKLFCKGQYGVAVKKIDAYNL